MSFNPSKCQLLRITKRRSPIQYDYTLHGHVLEQVSTAKYVGLNLHDQLSWNFHTDVTTKKANKTRSFIARNVHSCPKKVKAACYTTLVCPVMEYATTAWAPHTAQNFNKLEQVQRRAARFACHRYGRTVSVTSMLNDLKWETLETRRNNQRLTMFYRLQHNMVSISPADYLAPVQSSRSRRSGHDQMYQVPYARTDVSFFPATVRMWNALPASEADAAMRYRNLRLTLTLTSSVGHSPPSKQASAITTATEPRHVTIDHQCVILDHRGLHFTGR